MLPTLLLSSYGGVRWLWRPSGISRGDGFARFISPKNVGKLWPHFLNIIFCNFSANTFVESRTARRPPFPHLQPTKPLGNRVSAAISNCRNEFAVDTFFLQGPKSPLLGSKANGGNSNHKPFSWLSYPLPPLPSSHAFKKTFLAENRFLPFLFFRGIKKRLTVSTSAGACWMCPQCFFSSFFLLG